MSASGREREKQKKKSKRERIESYQLDSSFAASRTSNERPCLFGRGVGARGTRMEANCYHQLVVCLCFSLHVCVCVVMCWPFDIYDRHSRCPRIVIELRPFNEICWKVVGQFWKCKKT